MEGRCSLSAENDVLFKLVYTQSGIVSTNRVAQDFILFFKSVATLYLTYDNLSP